MFSGAHLALPFLTLMREMMLRIRVEEEEVAVREMKDGKKRKESRFLPERNHLYSGRNNDNKGNMAELFYFFTTIIPKLLLSPKLGGGDVCTD